jgi:hypothetical protein
MYAAGRNRMEQEKNIKKEAETAGIGTVRSQTM